MREKSACTGGKVSRAVGEAAAPKIAMATRSAANLCAHICAWEGEGCQLANDAKLVCQSVGDYFLLFCQILMDAKLICQTVGVALRIYVLFC
jgi:hypothetical protein